MTAIPSEFWAEIDQQIEANASQLGDKPTAEVIQLTAAAAPRARDKGAIVPPLAGLSDWTWVLDSIAAAKKLAQQHEARLHEQAAAHQRTLRGLSRELHQIQQQVRASETHAREVQAKADAQIREILEQAETRVQEVQAAAEERVRVFAEQANGAQQRADAAESWLQQIAEASQALVPSHTTVAA